MTKIDNGKNHKLRVKCVETLLFCVILLVTSVFCTSVPANAEESVILGPVSQEQQNAILAKSAQWIPTDGLDWNYTITDLDHNGHSEVICASMQGTGLFTWVHAYELSADGQTLVSLTEMTDEGLSFPDIMDSDCTCYYDPDSGEYHYVFMDYTRNGYAENYASYVGLTLHNGLFSMEYLATAITIFNTDNQELASWTDPGGTPITEADFLSAPDRAYPNCVKTSVTMNWTAVPQRSLQAEEVSADGITVHITKNPTGECLSPSGHAWFIAHADNAAALDWEMVSPWGTRYDMVEAQECLPGVEIEALEGDTLAVRNASSDLNGWAVIARFTNGNAYATTDPAYIYVGDYVNLYSQVLEGYRDLAGGGEGNGLVEWTDLETTGVSLGYRLKDLDADGTPEMIVAQRRADGTCGAGDIIYGVYTLFNGQPQEVFHSWARNRYYYTGGSFLNEGSSGAMYSDIMLLTVSYGNIYIRDGVYTDGDRAEIYFRVSGGDRYTGYSTGISEEEFNAAWNTYESYFCPLGQLTAIN